MSKKATELKTIKTALYILLIYMACQLSSFILIIFPSLKEKLLNMIDAATREDQAIILLGYWSTIAFAVALIWMLILISRDKNFWNIFPDKKANWSASIGWGVLGFFMIYIGQIIGASIEHAIGVDAGSANTAQLSSIMKAEPIMIVSIVILGPILEEFVFRRVIFGSLIQKYSFFISALMSGVVFAAIHLEFEHILLYSICGFIFAFLYNKTKRIITSIIAHMMLNGSVTLAQFFYDDIVDFLNKYEKMAFIFFN